MKIKLLCFFLIIGNCCFGQDIVFARKIVDTLTSPYFWGRGYTNDGVNKAAQFLTEQFKVYGLKPLSGQSFRQDFSYPVNIFPGKMEVAINGVALRPGKDFIVSPESRAAKGKGRLAQTDSIHFIDQDNRVIVALQNKLTWSVEQKAADYTGIEIDRKALTETPASIELNVENKVIRDFKTSNICGVVKGTDKPDSAIVFTAHYDHLGGMGSSTYFPGANDNASGIALLLGLAKYYATHPQRYSMVFICFSGEEAGLLGSKYFTEHPLLPLKNIRFLINADLEGTGEEGLMVVNATVYSKEYKILTNINNENHYLVKIGSRGKAANSDHYLFTEKGVPAFYIYTLGGIKAYHDVFDISATLPLNKYEDLIKLLQKFNEQLMQ